jgi:L-arabinonolactonase
MADVRRIGDTSLQWGESVRWDDRRDRLYFVDCATHTLYWIDGVSPPFRSLRLPSMPTGLVLTGDERLIVCLDGGLHVVDPDRGQVELLAPYPEGLGERANDAAADGSGNVVTGTLNLLPGEGSYWWFSARDGWRQLDEGISNANGPAVVGSGGDAMLVFADTHADSIYAYDYDGATGRTSNRRVLADTNEHKGSPDGACVDADDGIWSCILNAGRIVRFDQKGATDSVTPGVELPSDVTFGGPNLDRMFVVSIAISFRDREITSPDAGALLVVDDTGYRGRPEPRAVL